MTTNRLNLIFNNITIFIFSTFTSYNFAKENWTLFTLNLFGLIINILIRFTLLEEKKNE